MSSLQLINSHLVIDINKGLFLFRGSHRQAFVCHENIRNALFFLPPLVSKGTSSIYQLVFRAMELKPYNCSNKITFYGLRLLQPITCCFTLWLTTSVNCPDLLRVIRTNCVPVFLKIYLYIFLSTYIKATPLDHSK